jgi:hypothetical protein
MVFRPSRNSRVWKTALFLYARPVFWALLREEIRQHARKAERLGMLPAIRLNGTSDVIPAWNFAQQFPRVQFYDYTKNTRRASWENYHVTVSRSGDNDNDCVRVLAAGGNVAIVFSGELPATWKGFPVLDADETDARFMDPPGTVAGLTFKGNTNPADAGAFVVH